MEDWLNDLPPLRKPRKAKTKAELVVYRHDIKGLYLQAHEENIKRLYPMGYAGDRYKDFKVKFPDIKTTNGHKLYMKNVLNWLGHNADNRDTMGVPMLGPGGKPLLDKYGKIRYRKSGSTTGGTDMVNDIFVPGYPVAFSWKIEVKNKDIMGKAQIAYMEKMQRVKVLHSVIRVGELDLFWDEYYRILKL